MRWIPVRLLPVLAVLVVAGTASAADGVLEINQACATTTGCFSGDTAGFPVQITASGSYILTGALEPPDQNTGGILIGEDSITIDLNGFGILYPGPGCESGPCPVGLGAGIDYSPASMGSRVTVRNGSVRNAGADGIRLRHFPHVEGVAISNVAGSGLVMGGEGIIRANRITRVGGDGINAGTSTIVSENAISFSGLATSGQDLVGGVPTAGNYCRDGSCSRVPRLRYYLTTGLFKGSEADEDGTCAEGFHFASLWEILDTSNLRYDTDLGHTEDDSGEGPPNVAAAGAGWVRTGQAAATGVAGSGAGLFNCSNWTESSGGAGSAAIPQEDWTLAKPISPWTLTSWDCGFTVRVWCVED